MKLTNFTTSILIAIGLTSVFAQIDETHFLKNTRQLIFEGNRSGEGYFSEDGKFLIFQSEREIENPFFQIYVLDLETGESHRVSPGVGKTTCSFFQPGSDRVLFASTHLDASAKSKQKAEIDFRKSGKERRYNWDYDDQMDIFTTDRDGKDLRRLTSDLGYDAECAFSPDGKKIVFSSLRSAYPLEDLSDEDQKKFEIDPAYFGEIYIMNADGSDQRRLTNSPGYDGGPFFSADGSKIVWRRFDENGMISDIFTMNIDGTDQRQITDFGSMSWSPYFHPSGDYIIFMSNKLGFSNFELFLVDAHGDGDPIRVTHTDGFDGLPVFSSDGTKLCWTSKRTRSEKSQLFIADWNHETAIAKIQKDLNLNSEISANDLREKVEFFASDVLEGRMTGSNGAKIASDQIAKIFADLNLKPIGDHETYFQNFEFTSGMKINEDHNSLTVSDVSGEIDETILFVEKSFQPLSFTANDRVEGEVVFAGYGLSVPGEAGVGYDSYGDLDVKDKIVIVLRYVPEKVSVERRQQLNRYAGLRYKAMLARERGAKAILVLTGPNSPNAGKLTKLSFDTSLAGSGIVAGSISGKVGEAIFEIAHKSVEIIQSDLDIENPHAESAFEIADLRIEIEAGVDRIKKMDRNVIGLLEGEIDEYVMIGGHYDHIGFGEVGSLARKGEEGKIHNGADDNASGTAVVIEIANALAGSKPHRGIIFSLWSGEELGLIGSSHFAENQVVELEKIVAYVNFDMVGRLRENRLMLQGIGSSDVWTQIIEKRNVPAGFDLSLSDDPYLPTDVTAFYPKGVPVLSFFTGGHEDYNRPTDDPKTLNFDGMERISKFAKSIITDLAKNPDRPNYAKVERSKPSGGSRDGLRAYLGTIPDYVGEVEGVKITGVRGDSPADRSGLQGGDVIIELGGQKITNIYDYTFALDAVKIGEETEIVVIRNGDRKILKVTPQARN